MSTPALATAPLAGTWRLDPVHSTASFAVKYMGVTTFRSEFKEVTATLEAAADGATVLTGAVQAASVDIDNERFKGQVLGDDFLAADQHPELTFTSSSFTPEGGAVAIAGELTIKGATQPVTGRGELSGPIDDGMGNTRLAVTVETTIDRTAFGLTWNSPLPKGGHSLANDVKLVLDLFFVKA